MKSTCKHSICCQNISTEICVCGFLYLSGIIKINHLTKLCLYLLVFAEEKSPSNILIIRPTIMLEGSRLSFCTCYTSLPYFFIFRCTSTNVRSSHIFSHIPFNFAVLQGHFFVLKLLSICCWPLRGRGDTWVVHLSQQEMCFIDALGFFSVSTQTVLEAVRNALQPAIVYTQSLQ